MMRQGCRTCNGTGFSIDDVIDVCPECNGNGWCDTEFYTRPDNTPVLNTPAQTPMQPNNAQPTPTSRALEGMTDADLKARAEAAWAYLFVYLDEIRRRAGIVVQSEEIPF